MSKSADRKLLVHAPNWVGDHVMAFPFYRALRRIFPDHELHITGRRWVNELLEENMFDRVFSLPAAKSLRGIRKTFAGQNYEYSFTLSPSFRSALILLLAGAEYRLGFPGDFRSLVLRYPFRRTEMPAHSEQEHRAVSYLRLLQPFTGTDAALYLNSVLKATGPAIMSPQATEKLNRNRSEYGLNRSPYWVICPGTVAPSKVYPIRYLAEICSTVLRKNKSLKIVLVGSAIEKPYAIELLQLADPAVRNRIIDLTEKTGLPDLIGIMKGARGVIANDSGVAHMCYLSGSPLVTFIGMALREETLTLAAKKIVLDLQLSCSGCKKRICPRKDEPLACLTGIPPKAVLDGMKKLDHQLVL